MGANVSHCLASSKMDATLLSEIAAIEAKGTVLTLAAPGEMADKAVKHTPKLELASGKVTIAVAHGMEEAHWINYIWAKDEAGAVIGAVKLAHTDTPTVTIDVPEGTKSVTAYESCNLHGVWATVATPVA
ncbi:hypothetical protein T492DRAFT_1067177 [Pavlovales sp. CCMP2436]|nr:hypothetical protein T492DRAFT_1067177 [Pavlovales sp. CCMP2436]